MRMTLFAIVCQLSHRGEKKNLIWGKSTWCWIDRCASGARARRRFGRGQIGRLRADYLFRSGARRHEARGHHHKSASALPSRRFVQTTRESRRLPRSPAAKTRAVDDDSDRKRGETSWGSKIVWPEDVFDAAAQLLLTEFWIASIRNHRSRAKSRRVESKTAAETVIW